MDYLISIGYGDKKHKSEKYDSIYIKSQSSSPFTPDSPSPTPNISSKKANTGTNTPTSIKLDDTSNKESNKDE